MVQVMDDVMSLRERFCGGDDVVKHRRDFDWLLEAVTKVTESLLICIYVFYISVHRLNCVVVVVVVVQGRVEIVSYLVERCGLPVNCLSRDAGNT